MKLLVPIDDEKLSERAISRAISRLDAGDEIVLASVGELPETSEHAEDTRAALLRRLNEVAGRISGVETKLRYELAGDPARGLIEIAREEQVDGVVIASHDRSAFRQLIDGSVAEDLRDELAEIPVTVVEVDSD